MKKCMKCGGAMKKYAKGGSNVKMGIYGIPQENVGTSSQYMPTAKKGGVAKAKFGAAVAVKASCKKGMVRAADGRCVMERAKFKSGGSAFGMLSVKAGIDKNPGKTAADRIAGAKMNKRKK